MARNLSSLLYRELENLDKDPESRRAAMKFLKSYIKDLDSKVVPMFLARLTKTKELSSSSGECTICLLEILVRSQGRNIVPHVDNIMCTITRALSLSSGNLALHQSCSKVVLAITRYGIDLSMPDDEKARIISSLCHPLCDVLMGPQESTASGAALCLRALLDSDNWRFASDSVVNEICLKVAGALEELPTQTNSHMSLVMGLLKYNCFIAEAYARSFIRSGLQILSAGIKQKNSQKRLSAIQMINFLMKCIDSRNISSEIVSIINIMEKCQSDLTPFISGAASDALQTAKIIAAQKLSRHEMCSSPIMGLDMDTNGDRENYHEVRYNGDARAFGGPNEFSSPESHTINSFAGYDALLDSPKSIGQSSSNFDCHRRANRRWNSYSGSVDSTPKGGQIVSGSEGSVIRPERFMDGYLSEMREEDSGVLSATAFCCATLARTPTTHPSSQRSRRQHSVDDGKMYSTSRRLSRSLHNFADTNYDSHEGQQIVALPSSSFNEQERKQLMTLGRDSQKLNCEVNGSMRRLNKQHSVHYAELVPGCTQLASPISGVLADNSFRGLCRANHEDGYGVSMAKTGRWRLSKAAFSIVCCLITVILAIILLGWWIDDDNSFNVVPT